MGNSQGWIGVDLDGTLAKYDGWKGPAHVGEPVPLMLGRVKHMLDGGCDVRIFTARVSTRDPEELGTVVEAIEKWCEKHLGRKLPITCRKDYAMICLYDDRCVQIEPNTGRRVDGHP